LLLNLTMVVLQNWYVLYTKPKNEKKVAEQLTSAGLTVYCPLVKTVKQWSDRKKKISEPLFKSYIFVCLEEQQRDVVFQFPGVVRYLFWLGKPAIVRPVEIEAIKEFLGNENFSSIEACVFLPGQQVKVTSGLLKENTGEVIRVNKNKVVLQIASIGMALQAELHVSQVA